MTNNQIHHEIKFKCERCKDRGWAFIVRDKGKRKPNELIYIIKCYCSASFEVTQEKIHKISKIMKKAFEEAKNI